MSRLAAVSALTLLLLNSVAAATANDDFEALAERYVSDLVTFSPVSATRIGDHSADDKLDDVSKAARERRRDLYQDYLEALAAIDRDELSRANQVDYALLLHDLRNQKWRLEELQEWAWNPLVYT